MAGISLMRFFEQQQLGALVGLRGTAKAKLRERIIKILDGSPEGVTARRLRGMGLFPTTEGAQIVLDEMVKKGLASEEAYQNPKGGPKTNRYFSRAARTRDWNGNTQDGRGQYGKR